MPAPAKHIGIIACSAEGAALCYRTICDEAPVYMGNHQHPEISMHTYSLGDYMQPIYKNDWAEVASLMKKSASKLVNNGAELLICPDNTIHQSYDRAAQSVRKPWLHIAEVVLDEASKREYSTIGVLGTKYLMRGPVYKSIAETKDMIVHTPSTKQQEKINSIIFDELVYGKITEKSQERLVKIIQQLKDGGCQAVVLGCTELPLIIDDSVSPIPTLDSTRLLARAAIRASLSE